MVDVAQVQAQGAHSVRGWALVALLLAAATLGSALLDPYVSLTSQAMLYVLVIVVAAYTLDWLQSVVCAVGAVVALNFFFVPPRWTFDVESREHGVALVVMLVVALVISHLAAGLRRESRHAALNAQRARQLQALASSLALASSSEEIAVLGQRALDAAFGGPNALLLLDATNQLQGDGELPDNQRDGLRCCINECAVLGPGTGRWPGLNAWYLPLGERGQVLGAARVLPAQADDSDGREHAQALCALLAQTLWRIRLTASMQAARIEVQRQQLQSTFLCRRIARFAHPPGDHCRRRFGPANPARKIEPGGSGTAAGQYCRRGCVPVDGDREHPAIGAPDQPANGTETGLGIAGGNRRRGAGAGASARHRPAHQVEGPGRPAAAQGGPGVAGANAGKFARQRTAIQQRFD